MSYDTTRYLIQLSPFLQGFQREHLGGQAVSDPISDSEARCCLIYLSKLLFSKEFKGNPVIWEGRERDTER